jgi:hypothetical protein
MLGHDTSWAHAAVIQLCGNKSLVVKKVRVGGRAVGGRAVGG